MSFNYRSFIQDNFLIRTKIGERIPFVFNRTQNILYDLILAQYPSWQGVRENWLKFRQFGGSSLVTAIYATDFILGEIEEAPPTATDVYSHKIEETKSHGTRVSDWLDDFLQGRGRDPMIASPYPRKEFLAVDSDHELVGRRGSSFNLQTASAKVSGRGNTKQNILWTEPAFYSNTEILNAADLVLGAEQQVADGVGKIIRESTGNMIGDFFHGEYERGKQGHSAFTSRFLGWWLHPEYTLTAPADWMPAAEYVRLTREHGASLNQCYWHYRKVLSAKEPDKMRREYPVNDLEAFMRPGSGYFDLDALRYYKDHLQRMAISEGALA